MIMKYLKELYMCSIRILMDIQFPYFPTALKIKTYYIIKFKGIFKRRLHQEFKMG